MSEPKNAFLSYSHSDKEFAESLARALRENGVDVWFDAWEIRAGDSIVQKIFAHGLQSCDVFLIVLSEASVHSSWVRQELDAAAVQRIEGVTRIIPVVKETCEIPTPLRTLHWVDLGHSFDEGVQKILHAIYEVSVRPPLGPVPDYISELASSLGGLSQVATTVATVLLNSGDENRGTEGVFTGTELGVRLPILTMQQINDAVDELEEYGLIQTLKCKRSPAPGSAEARES